jgi:hypothetical protein
MDCLYFKTNKFQYWKLVLVQDWFITFFEGTKMNQSIDYVGVEAYPVSAEELVWITSKNWMLWITSVFDKMHQSRKRESRRWFLINKRKQLFEEIDDLDRLIWFILMLSVIVCNRNYGVLQYSKWCTQKQWRTSYLCCSWCS